MPAEDQSPMKTNVASILLLVPVVPVVIWTSQRTKKHDCWNAKNKCVWRKYAVRHIWARMRVHSYRKNVTANIRGKKQQVDKNRYKLLFALRRPESIPINESCCK